VRYQALGEENDGPAILFVHGLFVNADHWRRNLPAAAEAGFRVFAIDLLGSGYSDKPSPRSEETQAINGERGRDLGEPEVELSTSSGDMRRTAVPLAHPLGSVYNIYTWSEQLCDFAKEVLGASGAVLVGNSIGAVVGLQAASDEPQLFGGVLLVNPRFREEHVAEAPPVVRPFVSLVQGLLRETPVGRWLFDVIATPSNVKTILKEPYFDASQVTDELVDVLLSPLLSSGAAEVIFDTLSYSTGPLLEQQLQDGRISAPIWVCWGERDPWTPPKRVTSLKRFPAVKRVVGLPDVGHCPHDEAPDPFNSLLIEFASSVRSR